MIRVKKDKYIYIYILRMDYKIDKKRKVFKEKYDSDYSKVYKYFLIFTIN